MMKTLIVLFLACCPLLFSNALLSQCPTGAIGVSGAGCGCLSGCNLTSFGGPNCTGTTGNCTANQVSMSTDITVPAGCTITVTATMSNRGASCSASGADSGDQMKVDIPGGPKSFQTGASNATLNDSYVLVGPGTIRVSGTANRADEIITYSASSVGCVNCAAGLPIELKAFHAVPETQSVACIWQTETERDNDYFTVERSDDGITYEIVGQMNGAGNSLTPLSYKLYDSSPLTGLSYYRLRQTDFNGVSTHSDVVSVVFYPEDWTAVYRNEIRALFFSKDLKEGTNVKVVDAAGRLLVNQDITEPTQTIPLEVSNGVLYLQITSPELITSFSCIPVFESELLSK